VALVALTASQILVKEPKLALCALAEVLNFGTSKHGSFDPKLFTTDHFMDKYRRHMTRSFHTSLDESGQPHIIHAAADLLFAWECTVNKR
jgi:hypothetical protein